MDEQPSKKIKLSLEPFIDNKNVDITNIGQEITRIEPTLPEKLMQTVDRIWFERKEWKDITEQSLALSIKKDQAAGERGDDDLINSSSDDEKVDETNMTTATTTNFDVGKLRESVINKLSHAKSEIDVALDVINILIASNRSSSAIVKDLVLPAGSLTATYVTKSKPTVKAQLESVQLNLGLKRKKQKQASDFLKKSAASIKKLVEKEQVFWDEALDLRRNNWIMQGNMQSAAAAGGVGGGGINTLSSFLVQYGYQEVGSDFTEASVAELKRSIDDSDNGLQMSLPHGTFRKMVVNIHQTHMGGSLHLSEGLLGINNNQDAATVEEEEKVTTITSHSEIQNQLAEAHSTVFDAELFSDILTEALALHSNVRFPDDEIVIRIDGQIDLSIKRVPVLSTVNDQPVQQQILATQQIVSRTIDLSFRLLLLQHHRYNIWKNRAKILSSNHKIHQMLTQQHLNDINTAAINSNTNPSTPITSSGANSNDNGAVGATNAPGATNPAMNSNSNSTGNSTGTPKLVHTTLNNMNGNGSMNTPGSHVSGLNNSIGKNNSNNAVTTPTIIPTTPTTASAARARTRATAASHHHNQLVRDLPKKIPILSPIMALTRFWVQVDRIRHIVHLVTSPFTGNGGLGPFVHFKFEKIALTRLSGSKVAYDSFPGHSEMAISLGISILKGPALHFNLNQSGSISVRLPQTTIVLQNVSEFEAFLSREIQVICLRTVCDVANNLIRRSKAFKSASDNDKKNFIWKVNQVDEAINGSILSNIKGRRQWRNINTRLQQERYKNNTRTSSYTLLFKSSSSNSTIVQADESNSDDQQVEEKVYSVILSNVNSKPLPLTFQERVSIIINNIINDATLQQ